MSEIPPQDEHRSHSELPEQPGEGDTRRGEETQFVQPPQPRDRARTRQPMRQQPRQRDIRRAASASPPVQLPPAQVPPPPAVHPARMSRPVRARDSGLYLPWWSLVIMVMVVGAAALGLVLLVGALGEPETPGDQLPRVQIVTDQPTLSQDFAAGGSAPGAASSGAGFPTSIPQAAVTPTAPLPTPIPTPSLPPGEFTIGITVQVVGVESAGLNVRSSPGLEGTPRFLAYDEEFYVIIDGPQTADGLEWWRIEDPNDSDRAGWAARNYLTLSE
jgi:hypothetical protein